MILPEAKAGEDNISARRVQAFAFLSIFHPEKPLEVRLAMANEIAREGAKKHG